MQSVCVVAYVQYVDGTVVLAGTYRLYTVCMLMVL